MSLHMGAAVGTAAGKAMAEYLLEQQVSSQTLRAAAYYGQTAGVEDAIAQGYGAAPMLRADIDPALADALGLTLGQIITAEHLTGLLSGHRADGGDLPGGQTNQFRGGGASGKIGDRVRHRVAYLDLTLSAPKHVSLAWAFAETDAERNSLLQAHRTARDETLRYIERQAIRGALGDGTEPGRAAWITVDHFTARPTLEQVRTDPATGEVYTELRSAKVAGDPALHSHCLVPNLIRTQSGRFVAIDAMAFHGRIREFGAVYQALLARELTELGAAVALDPRTNMVRLPAIPEHVVDAFSKRSREGEAAGRAWAQKHGLGWDDITEEQRATLRKTGAHATRQDKETNIPDIDAWRAQARRIGWQHRSVLGSDAQAKKTRAERMQHADREGLGHLADMLTTRAVLGQGEARTAIARGFIAAGGLETTDEIGAMAQHWAKVGVLQEGAQTRLICKQVEGGKIRITTELHREQESELIALARTAVGERSHALASEAISAAIGRSGVSYTGRGGDDQRKAVETVGTDGAISVVIGVAGSGKSTAVLKPLVEAWRHHGLEVWGTAQAWRQAKDLRKAGIDNARVRALAPLLEAIADGQAAVGPRSVVVLDEVARIGTRQLLELLRLRERHGFKLVALGDDRQASSIEAGPVVDLLRRALGKERIPELLDTIRQEREREREIAGLWRTGDAEAAIKAKRADGTAELVPGGYREAVERVAALYVERRLATADRGAHYSITLSAPTNFDAHEISRLIRERRRDMGELGPDLARLDATDGRGNGHTLNLALGDRVRLFAQTRGVFKDRQGRSRTAVVGDNGSVLEVTGIDRHNGLSLRTEMGKRAFVSWEALRDRGGSERVKLAYGDALTVDTAQGLTADEHISAMPGGSTAVPAGKAYVQGSRHIGHHYLVGSMGAELREAQSRRMSGLPPMTPAEATSEAWGNLVRNLSRMTTKDSALDLIEQAAVTKVHTTKALQATLRRHEQRAADGQTATTVRETQDVAAVRKALPAVVEAVEAISVRYAAIADAAHAVADGELCYSEALDGLIADYLRRGGGESDAAIEAFDDKVGVRLANMILVLQELRAAAEPEEAAAPRQQTQQAESPTLGY